MEARAAEDAKMTSEDILRIMEEHVPFNKLLGIRGESIARGQAVLVLPVRADFVGDPRPPALHGGVLSTLIDTAGGVAAWSALDGEGTVSTVDLRVDYLEPGRVTGVLRADARVVRKGSRVCHVRVALTQDERLVAEGAGVYAIHRRKHKE